MKRARRQKGSLQKRIQGGTVVWSALWRDESGSRRSFTIGRVSKITKSKAQEKLAELVAGVNAKESPDPTLAEFIASAYLPAKRRERKESTRGTNEQRINTHLKRELGEKRISELRRELMAAFLESKAKAGHSYSLVAHLRWDLKAILDLAAADSLVPTNQAIVLTVPNVSGYRQQAHRDSTASRAGDWLTRDPGSAHRQTGILRNSSGGRGCFEQRRHRLRFAV